MNRIQNWKNMYNGKNGFRIILSGLLIISMMLSVAGCGNSGDKKDSAKKSKDGVVMTMDEYEVTLSEFNIYLLQYLSMQQLNPEDVKSEDVEEIKNTVVSQMKLEIIEYLLAQKTEDLNISEEDEAAVSTNVEGFIDTYGEELLGTYGIDKADVEKLFHEQMYINALVKKAKSDMAEDYKKKYEEEYKDKKFHSVTYALFPSIEYDEENNPVTDDNGEYVSLSKEELDAQKEKASELKERADSGEELEALIEEYGISAYSGTERNYEGAYSEELNQVIAGMENGDISDVVETDAGFMVVRMDNTDDTDYKEYVIQYAATDQANGKITQLQQNWIDMSGLAGVEPDKEMLSDVDIKSMCKKMVKAGIYETK